LRDDSILPAQREGGKTRLVRKVRTGRYGHSPCQLQGVTVGLLRPCPEGQEQQDNQQNYINLNRTFHCHLLRIICYEC
jgi:hypothetical protein